MWRVSSSAQPSQNGAALKKLHLTRKPELDELRGLFLVWMTPLISATKSSFDSDTSVNTGRFPGTDREKVALLISCLGF